MIGSRFSAGLLHALHFAMTLFLPFLLFLALGCNKIKEEKAEYGAEIPGAEIDRALLKATEGFSFDHIAVGQYLDHSVTRRLENEDTTMTLGKTLIEVIDEQSSGNVVTYTLRISKSERLAGGNFETKITEEPLRLKKTNLTSSAVAGSAIAKSTAAFEAQARNEAHVLDRKVKRITYHNLREFTEPLEAPKALRQRAGCGGLDPCILQVRYIRFEMVQWYEDGGSTKVSFDFGFSIQPPYLPFGESFDQFSGLIVVDCRSTYVPIETRTVYVRDCVTLEDFQK